MQPRHPKLPRRATRAFSTTEAMIAILIMACVAALLFPVMSASRTRSHQARCVSNLRQWSHLIMTYVSENNGHFPSDFVGTRGVDQISWNHHNAPIPKTLNIQDVASWRRGEGINGCPAHSGEHYRNTLTYRYYSYAINGHLTRATLKPFYGRISQVENPSKIALMADAANNVGGAPVVEFTNTSYANYHYTISVGRVHSGKCNVLFVDGHIEALPGLAAEQVHN